MTEVERRVSAREMNGARTSRSDLVVGVTIGVCSGALAGFFGVGGGILIVPALVFLLRMNQRLAHGTSLAAIVPIACVGVVGYAQSGSIDWVAAALITVGSCGGAVLGTHVLHRLPLRTLRVIFALFLVATAVRMCTGSVSSGHQVALGLVPVVALAIIGVVAGTMAGLLGVGGGLVMVPALTLLLAVPDAMAKGTSLAVIVPTAVVATVRNRKVGNVDLRLATAVGLGGTVASYVASRVSVATDPGLSRDLFAALLLVIAVTMLLTREKPAPAVSDGSSSES